MKVVPTQIVYYAFGDEPKNHVRRYPAEYKHKPDAGKPFELVKLEHYSPKSMEIVEATNEERAELERILAERKQHLEDLRKDAQQDRPRRKGGRSV